MPRVSWTFESVWQEKSDEEVIAAIAELDQYRQEAQQAILAEYRKRRPSQPDDGPAYDDEGALDDEEAPDDEETLGGEGMPGDEGAADHHGTAYSGAYHGPASGSLFPGPRAIRAEADSRFEPYAPLFAMADLDLYRRNSFRILGIDVERTEREIAKECERRQIRQKFGRNAPESRCAFPNLPAPDGEALRDAEQRLRDPELRFLQEFFWFWPLQPGAARSDAGLLAIASGDVEAASRYWLEKERGSSASSVCNHNLALLSHIGALELEPGLDARSSQVGSVRSEVQWKNALRRWADLVRDEVLWAAVRAKTKSHRDSRLDPAIADRMRESLPVALLSINAASIAKLAEGGQLDQAYVMASLVRASTFEKDAISEVFRRAAAPVHERVKAFCRRAKEDAENKRREAAQTARALLRDLSLSLKAMSCLLDDQGPLMDAAYDEVALALVVSAQNYLDETGDWAVCLDLLEEASDRARSASFQARIDKERTKARSRRLSSRLDPLLAGIKKITDSDLEPAVKLQILSEEVPGNLRELEEAEDKDQQLLEVAGDMFAQALRGVSIDLHNDSQDYAKALEAIDLAASYCADEGLRGHIGEDRLLIETHLRRQRLFKDLKPIKAAPTLRTLNGVGTTLYGRSDYDEETRSYLTTLYFVILFVPIFPLARYRVVQEESRRYRFLGKSPLRRSDKLHIAVAALATSLFFLMVSSDEQHGTTIRPDASSTPATNGYKGPPDSAFAPAVTASPTHQRPSERVPPSSRNGEPVDKHSSKEDLPPKAPVYDSYLDRLKSDIDSGKAELEQLESEVDSLRRQMDSYKSSIEYYARIIKRIEADSDAGYAVNRSEYDSAIAQHNYNVDLYNSLLPDFNSKVVHYKRLSANLNAKIDEYNRLIGSR